MVGEHDQQLLGIDIGGDGAIERQLQFFGMAAAGGVENGVDGQRAIVGAEQQHLLTGQRLALRGIEGEFFEFAPRHFAIIAEDFAQGGDHIGLDADAGLIEGLAHQRRQRLVAVGIAGQGAAELGRFHQRAKGVAWGEIIGFEHNGGAAGIVAQLGQRHDQRLGGIAHTDDALAAEQRHRACFQHQ